MANDSASLSRYQTNPADPTNAVRFYFVFRIFHAPELAVMN